MTISGNRIEYKADAVPQVDWDAGYGSSIHIGNSNLGGSHNTMRNVTVRCNTTRLEQANVDAFQHWGNAGIGIENAAVGDELNEPYDAALASSLCQVSDNLFENLTVEYNDFDVNCFNLRNISLVGTAQVGTNNNFRNIRIEHNRIRSVKGLHVFGASGTSNMGCEAEGALENLTISDNEILALRKTGWSAESSINSSGEQDDYGIQLIGASVADLDGASWDEPGEPAAWDKLQAKVSGIAIDSNRVTGFANGILVAAAECGRTHYVTGIPVDGVKILDNEIKTDGVNRNCRNDGITLVGAIDGGTGCTVHNVTISGNDVTANNGLLSAGFWYRGVTCRWGIRDNQVLHVTAENNRFTYQAPNDNGGFAIVTADAISGWGEIPYALGKSAVVLSASDNTASGYVWGSMALSELSLQAPAEESDFLNNAQQCSDDAVGSRYIDWSKDQIAENCEVPLFAGVCDKPNYRPGNLHRYYLSPCESGIRLAQEAISAPGCTEPGSKGVVTYCAVCDAELSRKTQELPALGHDWDEWVVSLEPTQTEDGVQVRRCKRCGETESAVIPNQSHVHSLSAVAGKPAACTEPGFAPYWTCSGCGLLFSDETGAHRIDAPVVLSALGHDWSAPAYAWAEDHSTVTASRVCKNDAGHVERETVNTTYRVTREATFDAEGEILYTAIFENEAFAAQTKAVRTPRLEDPNHPKPTLPCTGGNDCPGNVFIDMPPKGNWAHDAIDWAIVQKITSGTSTTTFSPSAGCTRAQVVTFLWRAAKEPAPTSKENPFKDVKESDYFYNAVLWAVEKGITVGTDPDKFSPGETCTRAQIVTFLYRYEGRPEVKPDDSFTDVKPGDYFADSVAWAVANGITKGTDPGKFSPSDTCTREQVVTFLYRDIAE